MRSAVWILASFIACGADLQWEDAIQRGRELQHAGRYLEAESILTTALKMARASEGSSVRLARSLSALGSVEQDLGRTAEAEKDYLRAIDADADQVEEKNESSVNCKGRFRKVFKDVVCYSLKTYVKTGKLPDDEAFSRFVAPKLLMALGGCALRVKSGQAGPEEVAPSETFKTLQKFQQDTRDLGFQRKIAMALVYLFCELKASKS